MWQYIHGQKEFKQSVQINGCINRIYIVYDYSGVMCSSLQIRCALKISVFPLWYQFETHSILRVVYFDYY